MENYQMHTIFYECLRCGYIAIHYKDMKTKTEKIDCPKCKKRLTVKY